MSKPRKPIRLERPKPPPGLKPNEMYGVLQSGQYFIHQTPKKPPRKKP